MLYIAHLFFIYLMIKTQFSHHMNQEVNIVESLPIDRVVLVQKPHTKTHIFGKVNNGKLAYRFFFQNKGIFVQLDKLDELDKVTDA